MTHKDIYELKNQKAMLDLLVHALQASPDIQWLCTLVEQNVFDDVPFAFEQQDTRDGLDWLKKWVIDFTAEDDESESDYLKLFIGLGRPLAPPWESVYTSEDGLLFQAETLDVRAWYEAYGVESKMKYNEPDDHIALELEFISFLTGQAIQSLEDGDEAKALEYIKGLSEFLIKHPLQWVFSWCKLVEDNAKGQFYKGISLLVSGALRQIAEQSDAVIT